MDDWKAIVLLVFAIGVAGHVDALERTVATLAFSVWGDDWEQQLEEFEELQKLPTRRQ